MEVQDTIIVKVIVLKYGRRTYCRQFERIKLLVDDLEMPILVIYIINALVRMINVIYLQ